MRIHELESRTGLDRATIRYYEKEGLLRPQRSENGYRDYSEEDAGELKKIMLLRELGLSIDTVRGLQQGSESFSEVMERQARVLESRTEHLQRARSVCQRLRDDDTDYRRLEPGQYQAMLDAPVLTAGGAGETRPFRETVRREVHPWRRLIARLLDYYLMNAVLFFVVVVLLRWRPVTEFMITALGYVSWWVMIPVDGALIRFTGTTPGKWMMGIRVADPWGGRLGLREAVSREAQVFGHGMGWGIPVYRLYRLYRSYRQYADYADLDWNEDAEQIFPAWNWVRKGMIPVSLALSVLLTAVSAMDAVFPKYRGKELKISQFAANYNTYNSILYGGNAKGMYSDGTFSEEGNKISIVLDNGEEVPYEPYGNFYYETKDGAITAVILHHSWYEGWYSIEPEKLSEYSAELWIGDQYKAAMIAAAAAQPGMNADKLDGFITELNEKLNRPAGDGVTWEYENLTFYWRTDVELYHQSQDENGGTTCYVTLELRIDFGN